MEPTDTPSPCGQKQQLPKLPWPLSLDREAQLGPVNKENNTIYYKMSALPKYRKDEISKSSHDTQTFPYVFRFVGDAPEASSNLTTAACSPLAA